MRQMRAPWHIVELKEGLVVTTANDQAIAYLYFDETLDRALITKRLTRDEAWRLARAFCRMPELLQAAKANAPAP